MGGDLTASFRKREDTIKQQAAQNAAGLLFQVVPSAHFQTFFSDQTAKNTYLPAGGEEPLKRERSEGAQESVATERMEDIVGLKLH